MPTRDPKGRGHAPNNAGRSPTVTSRPGYRSAADRKSSDQRWSFVDEQVPGIIGDAVDAVTAVGDAIQFGRSRDGGAYSITLYTPAGRVVVWSNTPADAAAELGLIIEDARLMTGD